MTFTKLEGRRLLRCQILTNGRRWFLSRTVRMKDRVAPKDLSKFKGGLPPVTIQMFKSEEDIISFLVGQGWAFLSF